MVVLGLSQTFSECSLLQSTHILTFNMHFSASAMSENIARYHLLKACSLLSSHGSECLQVIQ
jgi:hypothetical protein